MKYLFQTAAFAALAAVFIFSEGCSKDLSKRNNGTSAATSDMLSASKPNIVLILGDDVGYEIPTVDGGRSYSTPNLDRLAKSGMRFTQMRAAPLCSPSRFMLLTGKYNFRNYTVWGVMDTSQRTIGNMLKDAGYATCYAGKWQLDGGDASIRKFGFDKYSVWLPFKVCPEEAEGPRYKSARIYQGGDYLPDSVTNGKYSEDVCNDYVLNFIDSNKNKPFFVYYSMLLVHKPHSPTPDDPEYASWNPDPNNSDSTFYPSMVKYMDKKVGMVIKKLSDLGLLNNTLILYMGDNGTVRGMTSQFKKTTITGAKGSTVEYGIHVPLYCSWQGVIPPATINSTLIDFTDFLPTLAGVANVPLPANYGPLDGKSFYPQLMGTSTTPRGSIFTYFSPQNCNGGNKLARYAQDSVYKLYDNGKFYNFKKDVDELSPLADSVLTKKQKTIRQNLQNVLDQMHN